MNDSADGSSGPTHTRRRRLGGDVCAIFVHAGAGYHSVQNEKIHLQACEHAARAAMNVLNEGGAAVDAVEVAVRVLEDKEITNAGFGSNLSMEGTVECDATIMDHYGRSGAVGAVGQVQHPIHLARLILDYSTKPLSLKRVPPNLLAGPGATAFAASLQVPVVPPDHLISHAAQDRWIKWARDLKIAENRVPGLNQGMEDSGVLSHPAKDEPLIDLTDPSLTHEAGGSQHPPEHFSTSMPQAPPSAAENAATPPAKRMGMDAASTPSPPHVKWAGQRAGNDGGLGRRPGNDDDEVFVDTNPPMTRPRPSITSTIGNPSSIAREEGFTLAAIPTPILENADVLRQPFASQSLTPSKLRKDNAKPEQLSLIDDITDTVGAIAVDCLGNIAAGSSSGGIGMKHSGRIGPAALVGIGTAVVPVDVHDTEKTSVATVTSGTGEHMATTMAASTCANRLYNGTKKSDGGGSESTDDGEAVRSFVEQDFMGHPSVKNSYSAGGIGILGVKKTTDGVRFYFAHNTDSFGIKIWSVLTRQAIASMSSEEHKPRSVMSRSPEAGKITTGARSIKHHRVATWPPGHHSLWPPDADPPSPSAEQPAKRQKKTRAVVPSTGLPPSDPAFECPVSNGCYKAAYEDKMREVHRSKQALAERMARLTARRENRDNA
ncbi:MAG: hypothetical protein L6R37_007259 [Teloschistes peruensis]|nr:MAG: hypothetical protein L6R37_007259 [Teloschistes peruensis]